MSAKKTKAIKPNSVAVVKTGGPKIEVPESMTLLQAADELVRMHEEEQKIEEHKRMFPGFYFEDVMVAIKKGAERHFGWINSQVIRTFFGDEYPEIIDVTTDVDNRGRRTVTQAFMGTFKISALSNAKATTTASGPFNAGIVIQAKKKHGAAIRTFFDEVERVLQEESIFRNRAVSVTWEKTRWGEGVKMEIIHVTTNPNIVLSARTQMVVDVLLTADLKTESKRIWLFTGSYGNGKTETCLSMGSKALDMGYTFLYVKTPEHLPEILIGAKKYVPAMVFMEDIDQVASGSERSMVINDVLNTLDGTELKGVNIKAMFTTNHPERLNEALRRPGRIDNVVQFDNPDDAAKLEIVKRMLGKVKGFAKLDLDACVKALPSVQGAFIAEICTRAKQYGEHHGSVTTDIFKAAAVSMEDHIRLMNEQVEKDNSLGAAVKTLGSHLVNGQVSETLKGILQPIADDMGVELN